MDRARIHTTYPTPALSFHPSGTALYLIHTCKSFSALLSRQHHINFNWCSFKNNISFLRTETILKLITFLGKLSIFAGSIVKIIIMTAIGSICKVFHFLQTVSHPHISKVLWNKNGVYKTACISDPTFVIKYLCPQIYANIWIVKR